MLGIALVLLWVLTWTPPVHAECVVDTDSPTFVDGKRIDLRCNASGELITSGGGGGGSGDASLAEQQTQTGILTTIDSDTGTIAGAVKAEDAAHTTGDTGVMALCVRSATPSDRSAGATDGDYEPCAVDASGRIHTSANLQTIAGTTADTNSGNKSAGTLRVVLATDQPALTNKLLVTPDADSAVNISQMNGVAVTMGNGASGTGVQRVTIASDSTGQVAIASLPNEGQQTMANSISVSLASDQTVPDPCTFRAKSYAVINSSTAATTQLVAASASNKLYVCSLHMITNAANNVAFVEDDTSACASPTAGIVGGTTSGTGYILAANGGLTLGNGAGTVGVTASTNRYVCIITSAATQLSGGLSYVLAP